MFAAGLTLGCFGAGWERSGVEWSGVERSGVEWSGGGLLVYTSISSGTEICLAEEPYEMKESERDKRGKHCQTSS